MTYSLRDAITTLGYSVDTNLRQVDEELQLQPYSVMETIRWANRPEIILGDPPSFDVKDAIQRFAPEVRLHPDDEYHPSSVEWYLARTHLRLDIELGDDKHVLNKGDVTVSSLINQFRDSQHSGRRYKSSFFLQIPNDPLVEEWTRRGDLDSAVCYAIFLPVFDGTSISPAQNESAYEIQYWFFYPYSGPIGRPSFGGHEGDWEHITVRITDDGRKSLALYYAAHEDEGKWYIPSEVTWTDTHPIVYSATDSHASYRSSGLKIRGTVLPSDDCADGGPVWQCWKNVILAGYQGVPQNGCEWLRYSGLWGEIGPFFSGPVGPAFKDTWYGEDSDYGGPKLVFKEENRCREDNVGMTTDEDGQVIKAKLRRGWSNDEARSLRLLNCRAGTTIMVFDHPSADRDDDWARIEVKRFVREYCIETFEQNREDDQVRITYTPHNGLDGKVSRIEVNR